MRNLLPNNTIIGLQLDYFACETFLFYLHGKEPFYWLFTLQSSKIKINKGVDTYCIVQYIHENR